jgi:hypothetical protein
MVEREEISNPLTSVVKKTFIPASRRDAAGIKRRKGILCVGTDVSLYLRRGSTHNKWLIKEMPTANFAETDIKPFLFTLARFTTYKMQRVFNDYS